ncbi:hypothetical protein [Metabacillus fastidiosus]|uniref:Uncharacterized protein n=1 Tax=Metabacillus fastidiosus TaxID=1458 RepID=A0ABU6NRK8_9BACI|nr:hypothetical protein [Metabacillus fastidiosus]
MKYSKYIKGYIPYFIFISIFLADLIMYGGLVRMFFGKMDTTIIAGIISFIGAVLGGTITYVGVRKTLQHRDREVFMTGITEKLMINDGLINTYKNFLNASFFMRSLEFESDEEKERLVEFIKKMLTQLDDDNEKFYKCMDYDAIRIMDFHKKSLNGSIAKRPITIDNANNCIEKVGSIYQVISVNKTQLEEKYYKYKRNK